MANGRKTGGRQVGTPNKVTTAFKQAVSIVYENLGGHAAFTEWARENPTEFYRIAARLIPTEIAEREGVTIQVIIADPLAQRDAVPALPDYVEH